MIIIFNLFQKTYAQAPEMEWHKVYNGSGEESHPHYVIESSDKGFVMIGETGFVHDNTAKIYVVKTDSLGQLEWEKELGTGGWNLGNCVVESDDGHFVCAGSLDYNMILVKLNHLTGDTIWQKTWDLGTEDALEGVAVDAGGDIIAVGYRDGLAENTFINWGKGNVIKTNTDGELIYNIDISSYMSSGYRVVPIPDNQYMISGHPADEGVGLDYTLIKMDYNGNIIWGKTPHPDIYWGFDVDSQGNMYLSGHTDSPLSDNLDICTVKIDSSGNELWKEYVGQPRGYNGDWIHDEIWGLRVTPDGGTIVCSGTGDEYSYSQCGHPGGCSDRWNVYLTKYSTQGTLLWEGLYADLDLWGSQGDNAGEDVCVTSDGGYLVANDVGGFGFTKIKPDTVTVPNFYKLSVDQSGEGIVYPYVLNVTKGEDIEISATPDDGWQFDSWTGDITDTGNPLSVTMNANISVTANFSPTSPTTLTTAAVNGSVSPFGGTYPEGTVVTLTATPDSGYQFENWSGDARGTTNPIDVTMDGNKSITANFSESSWIKIDDRDAGISYSGPWVDVSAYSDAYRGTVKVITSNGDAAYSFNGIRARVYLYGFGESQSASCSIDGGATSDASVISGGSTMVWESDLLASGNHTLTIGQSSGEVHLDAIEYNNGEGLNSANSNEIKPFDVILYPNPFRDGTSITYYVSERSNVEVCIYDHLGRKTTTLISKSQSAGEHSGYWDAEGCSPGIYIYKIRIGNDKVSGKMVLSN